jgi:putative hydrolase of the HAD superfamily
MTFKKERSKYFYKNFNSLNKSIEEVEIVFRNIDLKCNSINEITGKNIDAEEMYLMVIFYLNGSIKPFENIDLTALYLEMEKLFLEYSPILFNNETQNCLDKIKQNTKNTLNILSNTGFIKGKTLKKVLDNLEISKYFNFEIYSDEIGFSKPNIKIYNNLIFEINNLRNNTISMNEIIHIGDNYNADILGAQKAGIKTFQVNSNNNSIIDLIN